jgi:hypothetical protein
VVRATRRERLIGRKSSSFTPQKRVRNYAHPFSMGIDAVAPEIPVGVDAFDTSSSPQAFARLPARRDP